MQHCNKCGKILEDDSMVMVTGPAHFEQFSPGVHRASLQDIDLIWCMKCQDQNNESE